MTRAPLFVVVLAAALATSGSALAHGDLKRSDPERGDHVPRSPKTIELDFAEPPTAESRFEVTDGCKENVPASVGGEGPHAVLAIDGGAPGRWKVSYRTVSSIDGHLVSGSFSFHVGNKRPCVEPEPSETVDLGAPEPPIDDADSGLPIVPIALAGVGIVGAALLIRRMGGA